LSPVCASSPSRSPDRHRGCGQDLRQPREGTYKPFETIEELRQALLEFRETYNTTWFQGSVPIDEAKVTTEARSHFKMFTARATTSKATISEIASSAIIISFIHGRMAETSVGLNAVAVANEKWK